MEGDEKEVPEQPNQSIVGTRIDEPVQEPGNTQGVPVPCGISPIERPRAIERIARPQTAGTQSARPQNEKPQSARRHTRTISGPIRRYRQIIYRPRPDRATAKAIVSDTFPAIAGPSGIQRNKEEAKIEPEPVIQLPPKPKSAIVMMAELLALEQTKKVDSEMQSEKALIKKRLLKGKMKISSDINHIWCPSCSEIESDSPWIQCDTCTRWWHQDCTLYRGSGEFLCEICRF
ncbi:unnamed protein product [Ceutorhynchus assimilis]|uniref:Zinc finger PHD-type domain-containing protein n=1 Tax=Ceutorhynchus assimilis TaxID=467358 RepID=A0A9N9MDR3_9CUCU|nr:unnamed protein product [Ceutorhynchus assimilis]